MRGLFPSEPGNAAHGFVPGRRKVRIKAILFFWSFFGPCTPFRNSDPGFLIKTRLPLVATVPVLGHLL